MLRLSLGDEKKATPRFMLKGRENQIASLSLWFTFSNALTIVILCFSSVNNFAIDLLNNFYIIMSDGDIICETNKRKLVDENNDTSVKKVKLSQNEVINDVKSDFEGTSLVSVLHDNRSQKVIFLHGKFENDQENDAVIILEKKPLEIEALSKILSSETKLDLDLKNDIYATYSAHLPSNIADVKATVIYPATKKHLEKYKSQKITAVAESRNDYNCITKPFLETQLETNVFDIQWVYNILDHKKEEDRIIFEDPNKETGFVLLPDMKWDGKDADSLYIVAIPHKRGIKSLRDLTSKHIPLLKNIEEKAYSEIKKRFDVGKEKLRMYFHYQPSYYHLHVHINCIAVDIPGTGVLRAHLLNDVVENLQLSSNYYKEKTLSFTLRENDKLLHEFLKQKSRS